MNENICFPFTGDSLCGTHLSSLLIIKKNKKKKKIIVILHKKGVFSKYLDKHKIEYKYHPIFSFIGTSSSKLKNILCLLILLPNIIYLILKYKIKIVHSNDMRIHLTWIIPTLILKKKFIWHQRTILPESRITKNLIKFSTKIICISKYVKNSIPKRQSHKIEIIRNPITENKKKINKNFYRNKILEGFKNKDRVKIVSFFGNLQRIKQPEILINIASKLKKSGIPVIIAIFGTDKESFIPKLTKIANEMKVNKKVIFMGFKNPVEPWMKSSDIVIATSLGDGFGRTIIEAMSLKIPIIATNAGAHSELIIDRTNGILVKKNSADAMANAILKFLNNRNFREMSINNGFKFSKNFNLPKILPSIEKIYSE